ncbi:MFS transporter [Halobacteriaceae archaeon GCM10025711]
MSGATRTPYLDREFVALSGTAFARSQAYSTVLIALALYADLFGTTGFIEGLFGTAFAAAQLLIVLPLGRAIDTGNAKKFLLAGLLINVVVFGGFMLVQDPVHVIIVRILQGVGASILWITGSAVIGEISPDGARGRWLGNYNQVGAFSSLAGDVVGGYLLHYHGFQLTYVVLAGVTLLAFLLVFRYLRDNPGGQKDPEDATGTETLRALLDRPMVRSLVAFRLAFSVGKMAVIIFLPIFARKEFGISALAIGGILAGGKLTKSLLQGVMGDLTDRYGRKHYFVLVGALLYGVGVALIPFASVAEHSVPPVTLAGFDRSVTLSGAFLTLFAAYGVLGVADSIRLPASMTLFIEEGERFDSVASSMSLRSISWKIGQLVGPVMVGVIKDTVSTAAGFWTAAGFVVVASGVFLVTYTRSQRSVAASSVPGD